MRLIKDPKKYFYTSSLTLAAFLYAKGEKMGEIIPVHGQENKKEFVFLKTLRLEELTQKYRFGEYDDSDLLVSVHLYERTRNELLDRLNGY